MTRASKSAAGAGRRAAPARSVPAGKAVRAGVPRVAGARAGTGRKSSGVLDALVEGLFDYAGMYPPASLEFEAALAQAAGFHASLRRPRLVAAEAVLTFRYFERLYPRVLDAAGFAQDRPVRVAVLGSPLFPQGPLLEEARAIAGHARGEPPSRVRVVSLETKIPAGSFDEAPPVRRSDPAPDPANAAVRVAIRRALESILGVLAGTSVRLYLEPDWKVQGDAWLSGGMLAEVERLRQADGTAAAGLKVRGSGPTAIGERDLGLVVRHVVGRRIPLKATAGLHHPIIERARHANALGFLNLAAALRLRGALGAARFGDEAVDACLVEERASAFRFDRGRLSWRDHSITLAELASARSALPFSIGSCSLTEPDADLVRLFASA